jgi:hypothetical protein
MGPAWASRGNAHLSAMSGSRPLAARLYAPIVSSSERDARAIVVRFLKACIGLILQTSVGLWDGVEQAEKGCRSSSRI